MIDSNETLMYENGRDAGYAEGFEDGVNSKIETFEPHPTEAIVLRFNFENIDLYTISNLVEKFENKFPKNTIVALPDKVSLESWSKDVLENYISMISEIIETL